jgi:hypothetical protein
MSYYMSIYHKVYKSLQRKQNKTKQNKTKQKNEKHHFFIGGFI